MIFGIGVDTADIARVAQSAQSAAFCARVFGAEEQALFAAAHAHAAATMAANFAAKEAFGKALGTGLAGFAWPEVQALRRGDGAPYYAFSGEAARTMREKGLTAHLSLTHESGLATAFAVLEAR